MNPPRTKRAPQGLNDVSRVRVTGVQRALLLEAAVDVVAEFGYGRGFMARVVERAGVSREVFDRVFGDREACLLAVCDAAVARIAALIAPAYGGGSGWRERIRAALVVLLECLDYEPDVARLLIVDVLGGGSRVLERRREILAVLVAAVDEGRGEPGSGKGVPPLTAEGVVGAVLSVLHTRLSQQEPGSLYELLNPLMGLVVLPYLGPAAAAKELACPVSQAKLVRPEPRRDRLVELGMRATYRTLRVLATIASRPGVSNREVAEGAGITDEGQISRLLARLQRLGLIESGGQGRVKGVPNAWRLTTEGLEVEHALRERVDDTSPCARASRKPVGASSG